MKFLFKLKNPTKYLHTLKKSWGSQITGDTLPPCVIIKQPESKFVQPEMWLQDILLFLKHIQVALAEILALCLLCPFLYNFSVSFIFQANTGVRGLILKLSSAFSDHTPSIPQDSVPSCCQLLIKIDLIPTHPPRWSLLINHPFHSLRPSWEQHSAWLSCRSRAGKWILKQNATAA